MNPSDFGADIFDSDERRKAGDQPDPAPEKSTKKKRSRRSRSKAATTDPDEADGTPAAGVVAAAAGADDGGADDGRADDGGDAESTGDAEPPGDAEPTGDSPEATAAPRSRRKRRARKATAPAESAPDAAEPDEVEPVGARPDRPAAEDDEAPDDLVFGGPDAADLDDEDARAERVERAGSDDAGDDDEDEPTDDGDADSEPRADDDRGGRRRRRRRRRGRRDRDDRDERDAPAEVADRATRDDDEDAAPPPREPLRARRTDRMIPVPTPDGESLGQRVAVLIDLERLVADAEGAGGEIAFGKLLQRVARRRHLIRAIGYAAGPVATAPASALRACGIEVQQVDRDEDLRLALAVDAMALAPRVDCVVLVPETRGLAPMARALRAQGVRLESAGFTPATDGDDDSLQVRHVLGTEALFEP